LHVTIWAAVFYAFVITHVVRLKGPKHDRSTLAECDSCIKHGFKMRFFLTVLNPLPGRSLRRSLVQPIHLSYMLLALITVGCNVAGEYNMTNAAIQEITYHFKDASVPPEYHRSYTISVTTDKVGIVVDSYGKLLADKRYEITNKQFDGIRNSLERNKIRNCTLADDKGCTGGTIERISFSDKKNEIFSGSVYHCGGKDTGNLCGDITSFADAVKNLVPNLDKLLL
jgi:hypothetical protein